MIEQIKNNQKYASKASCDFEEMKCVDPDSLRFAQRNLMEFGNSVRLPIF